MVLRNTFLTFPSLSINFFKKSGSIGSGTKINYIGDGFYTINGWVIPEKELYSGKDRT